MRIRAEWNWHLTELWIGLATATALLLKVLAVDAAPAIDGEARIRVSDTNVLIQIRGADGDDWRLDASEDLVSWTNWTSFGTLLSGDEDAPEKALPSSAGSQKFIRAVRTSGLYDPVVLRTFSLTFTQANWQTRLTSGRNTGSNTLGNLALDNGAVVTGIGARYRGNTSFDMGGVKKSLNIEMDFSDAGADLMGFSTVNLNNAAGDETIMREPLYFTVMSQYAVSPKGAMARLFINNTNWGVYSLAQQQDGDLLDAWFPSNNGDRWRAPNMAGGGGRPGGGPGGGFGGSSSALSWLGTNIEQ
ncbi:MAG: CotH kinase family protein [Verrucomicrobiia bacterium]